MFIFEHNYNYLRIMKSIIQSLENVFPLSNQCGGDQKGINSQKMKWMALQGYRPDQAKILQMLELHYEFLASGGAGGKWKALQVGDIVIGFYDKEVEGKGEQAIFERMNLEHLNFADLEFPFANFCGVHGDASIFKNANLGHSTFTDSSLVEARFEGAYLRQVDFSRSDLRAACFRGANLSGADFENCNLEGADFTDAKISTARFPGAKLQNVLY